jgi:hypothetical protein
VNAAIQAIVDENKVPAYESCHEHTLRLLQHAVSLTLVSLLSINTPASSKKNAFLVTRFPPDATTGAFLIDQDRKLNTAVECITTGTKARPDSLDNARRDGQ